mmetsp:Transcript_82905/g.162546  ORF Transcript_82905/g.162546 Transcript_82905/m.162546 type:complete len:95 (+) Transcript_82905:102-386(+)
MADERPLATQADRDQFLRGEVRPLLESLAVAYYATTPPPEDIVGFLIETLLRTKNLPTPPEGALDEDEEIDAQDLQERIKDLKVQIEHLSSKRR